MDYSDLLLRHPGAVDEAGFAIASHLMDLAALGLARAAMWQRAPGVAACDADAGDVKRSSEACPRT